MGRAHRVGNKDRAGAGAEGRAGGRAGGGREREREIGRESGGLEGEEGGRERTSPERWDRWDGDGDALARRRRETETGSESSRSSLLYFPLYFTPYPIPLLFQSVPKSALLPFLGSIPSFSPAPPAPPTHPSIHPACKSDPRLPRARGPTAACPSPPAQPATPPR